MSGFGAKAYAAVAVDSGVKTSDPHQMVLMLFDGALEAVRVAQGHLAAGHVAEKGVAISKAIRIVDEGLRVSLDLNAGGALARQLAALYEYVVLRLLQANLRNDDAALIEVARLLGDLRSAWAAIGKGAAAAPPSTVNNAAAAPAPRFFDGGGSGPVRRVTASA